MVTPSLLPEEKPKPTETIDTEALLEQEQVPVLEVPETGIEAPEIAPEAPEIAPEVTEEIETPVEPIQEVPPLQAPPEPSQPIAPAGPVKDRLTKEIETVLEEDLTDLFLKLPPNKQKEFQAKGEETASKIRQIVQKSKINARKIFSLIRDWLKIIPGVNKFFLEQEAKIKTDKVILITEEERRRSSNDIT